MIGEWQSAIANADFADWVTVAGYLAAAGLSVRAAGRARIEQAAREIAFWRLTAVLLVLLGINELLDLQALLTSAGRAYAKEGGWYENRRSVQFAFVVILAIAAAVVGAATIWLTRRTHVAVRIALIGLVFIGLFILLRAASIHHLTDVLGRGLPAFNLGSVQEMAGILVVAAGAWMYVRGERETQPIEEVSAAESDQTHRDS